MLIKKIVHIADVHIKNYQRLDEFKELVEILDNQLTNEFSGINDYNEKLIVIAGDLVDQKNTISNELIVFVSTFLRRLYQIAPVVVISGNHDLIESNATRMDTLTGIFNTATFDHQRCIFLDQELGYHSGNYVLGNICFRLYSIWDKYALPPLPEQDQVDKVQIGLFHGPLIGSKLFNQSDMDNGITTDIFDGCDFVLAGDIHKRQELNFNGIRIVYPGSLIQKDFGETITNHGYAVWSYNEQTKSYDYELRDVETEYGLYKFSLSSIDDLNEDKEKLLNL